MLLNNGKYVSSTVTTEPSYVGTPGETLVYVAGPTTAYLATYTQYGWFFFTGVLGPLP